MKAIAQETSEQLVPTLTAGLYIVGTPIGNLGDITVRALDTLRAVDLIASEDTRKTGIMLKRYEIDKPQMSFYEHNEERAGARIIEHITEGKSVALVTSAGTPSVSDPGYTLVRKAIEADVDVTMIPGPSAFVMALVLSGLPVHSFTFRGFPPRKPGRRRNFLGVDKDSPYTLIYYESPYRIKALLDDALQVFGDRQCAVANDLTKLFERVSRGTLSEVVVELQEIEPKGEYTVVIAGLDAKL